MNYRQDKYGNPLSIYNEVPLDEWGTRLMIRKTSDICQTPEIYNVITTISKQTMHQVSNDEVKDHEGFGVNIDINTIAENTNARFTSSHIREFIISAVTWWDQIISELDGLT